MDNSLKLEGYIAELTAATRRLSELYPTASAHGAPLYEVSAEAWNLQRRASASLTKIQRLLAGPDDLLQTLTIQVCKPTAFSPFSFSIFYFFVRFFMLLAGLFQFSVKSSYHRKRDRFCSLKSADCQAYGVTHLLKKSVCIVGLTETMTDPIARVSAMAGRVPSARMHTAQRQRVGTGGGRPCRGA